jgi:putative nucleotidyltransferase with HDIG domain
MVLESLTRDQRLLLIEDSINRMPGLPSAVSRVLEICCLPNPSPSDLNKAISLDPALTGQVLNLSNSAYFSLPNHISSLSRAIIMLGINSIKNLVLSTAILGYLGKHASFPCLAVDHFWKHSIAVGVTAKMLAAEKGIDPGSREEFFVAGLLHDLGKVLLSSQSPEAYNQAMLLAELEQKPLFQAEVSILGLDHGKVGRLMAEKWQLNSALGDCLEFHHDPVKAAEPHRMLVTIVALADSCANLHDSGTAETGHPKDHWLAHLLQQAEMSWPVVLSLRGQINSEVEKAQVFLQIPREALSP